MRLLEVAVLVCLFVVSAGVGVAWANGPAPAVRGGSPTTTGPSSRPEPSPSPSPLPPCTTTVVTDSLVHDHDVIGNPRPYVLPSPADPPPEAGIQFDLPQEYSPRSPASILIYPTVTARVRAQFGFPESDTVGGSGRLIWSLDSIAASYAARYKLTLGAITARDQPCGQPEG